MSSADNLEWFCAVENFLILYIIHDKGDWNHIFVMVFSKMADLATLVEHEVPDGRRSLQESHANLERVAEYCETKYFQVIARHFS